MKESKQIADEIINSIPAYCGNDKLKIFTYVYVKVAHMLVYDDYAAQVIDMHLGGYDLEQMDEHIIMPASTLECLSRGRALCSGYATVLEYILNNLGIETIKVRCKGKHVWNQVKIDGIWYNCDLTNDCDFILNGLECPHFLKSNADDCNFTLRYPTSYFNECKTSISAELQEQLLIEANNYRNELEDSQNKTKKEINYTNELEDSQNKTQEQKFIQIIKRLLSKGKGVSKK